MFPKVRQRAGLVGEPAEGCTWHATFSDGLIAKVGCALGSGWLLSQGRISL